MKDEMLLDGETTRVIIKICRGKALIKYRSSTNNTYVILAKNKEEFGGIMSNLWEGYSR